MLNKINNPSDIKLMNYDELNKLAKEIRELIIKKVNTTGGHMAPNLGIVETTLALHYVFNSPKDKIIFDVSHQCYPHKIITGRKMDLQKKQTTTNIQVIQPLKKVFTIYSK